MLFDAPNTSGADSPQVEAIREYADNLHSQGVPVSLELVPGTGETLSPLARNLPR